MWTPEDRIPRASRELHVGWVLACLLPYLLGLGLTWVFDPRGHPSRLLVAIGIGFAVAYALFLIRA